MRRKANQVMQFSMTLSVSFEKAYGVSPLSSMVLAHWQRADAPRSPKPTPSGTDSRALREWIRLESAATPDPLPAFDLPLLLCDSFVMRTASMA